MMRAWLTTMAAATAFLAAPVAQAETTLILGGSDSVGSIIDRSNAKFAELVNERSGGELTINFIQGEQLGNDMQVIEQMMGGSVQVYGDVLDWYANWVQDLSVLAWGFTFRDLDHLQAFIDSELFAQYAEELRTQHGIRVLAAAPSQPRVLFAKKAVEAPAELSEIKMRVPDIRAYLLLWETLGTQPSRVAWGEVYLGLQTGVIDACEGPVLSAMSAKMYEPAPFVMQTDHVIAAYQISINEAAYQELSPELQAILVEAAQEAAAWSRQQATAEIAAAYETMAAEGATIVAVDKAPFAEAALAGVAQMEADGVWSTGLYEKIQALQ
jgi:TRAP-type transport system periplasmic protein